MPAIGTTDQTKRSATALEDIAERIAALVEAKAKQAETGGWIFKVNRDSEGFISTVEATPKT
jgi:hypothetical protein